MIRLFESGGSWRFLDTALPQLHLKYVFCLSSISEDDGWFPKKNIALKHGSHI